MFAPKLGEMWIAVSNVLAAGMMLSASASLVGEGTMMKDEGGEGFFASAPARVILGLLIGIAFIIVSSKYLDDYEDLKLGNLHGMNAKKALLVMAVMFLHSFAEGVGIGAAFGGESGAHLGMFVSLTLAVHNVPEGLAIALVLVPRGVSITGAALWCIFSSIPQPIMAVPAYLFVEHFRPGVPVGLGFAAGAMCYVALFEIIAEARHHLSDRSVVCGVIAAGLGMSLLQLYLKDSFHD